ncbi:hypothetical protein M569_12062, partial [Genlisea aurea]
SFEDFQRQTSLMTSCTLLWKELSDHFYSLEQDLIRKSDALKVRLQDLNDHTSRSLKALDSRESSISRSISAALQKLEENAKMSLDVCENPQVDDSEGVLMILKGFCRRMAVKDLWIFVTSRKKDLELFRSELPKALADCIDPPRFVLEAISEVFPVSINNTSDLGWACVLLLESLIPLMMDPVLGKERMLVTPKIKGRAEEIAETWKRSLEERGGIENVKTPDVHTFLQHLVTFGTVKQEDLNLYRKLVVASAWRKQMPKLAISLGLRDKMPDMIQELIGNGQQVDAVHFTYEVGLVDRFPPVPLLKAFLNDARKAANSILEDQNNSGRAAHMAAKKEQSAIRAVLKCIEEYKLESEFPTENLRKRLDHLDKAKVEKKKPSSPTAKRTRASIGGPMPPPAKAVRSSNAYVSSFPSPPPPPPTTYIISSPSHTQYPVSAAYPSAPPPPVYGHGTP